jgi:serine O-acetyltransferase
MDILRNWLESSLPDVVSSLEESISSGYHLERDESLSVAARDEIFQILDTLHSILFPGRYGRQCPARGEDLHFFLHTSLLEGAALLKRHIGNILSHRESVDNLEQRVATVISTLFEDLPDIRMQLIEDIRSAFDGDPAAKSYDEIVLSYPFIEAIATHRVAHCLYRQKVPIIPRIMSERAHSRTGIDIHPGAQIAPGFFIDHGTGVVIGETCTIGRNVKIYQGVTLGALSPFDRDGTPKRGVKRHPDIEDDVIIYANATILGGDTVIGRGAVIGGNTWIVRSVEPGAVIYNRE